MISERKMYYVATFPGHPDKAWALVIDDSEIIKSVPNVLAEWEIERPGSRVFRVEKPLAMSMLENGNGFRP